MISKEHLKFIIYAGIGIAIVIIGNLASDFVIKPMINRAKAPSPPEQVKAS